MKLSLKLQDDYKKQIQNPLLLKAKLPVFIFNQPFTSSLTTATTASTKHLSFSLSTNVSFGPSFRLTYTPLSSNETPASAAPFSVSLKSGLGLFGSPHDSPFIFSAHFFLPSSNPSNISPTFLLCFKPQFGHFSLHKITSSANPTPKGLGSRSVSAANLQSGSPSNSDFASGSVVNEALDWQDVKLEPCSGSENGFGNGKPTFFNGIDSGDRIGFVKESVLELKDDARAGLFGGISVKAKTVLPVTKGLKMNLRWGVNLTANSEDRMLYLTVNKIGIERVEKVDEVKKMNSESNLGDLELLKGMCFWMNRDLELLEKENKYMKQCLEGMRSYLGVIDSIGKVFPYSSESVSEARIYNGSSDSTGKKSVPSSSDSFGELERRKSKKNGEGNGKTEVKKPVSQVSDLECELQKAIMAAASS